jgi:hypothetical protein
VPSTVGVGEAGSGVDVSVRASPFVSGVAVGVVEARAGPDSGAEPIGAEIPSIIEAGVSVGVEVGIGPGVNVEVEVGV